VEEKKGSTRSGDSGSMDAGKITREREANGGSCGKRHAVRVLILTTPSFLPIILPPPPPTKHHGPGRSRGPKLDRATSP
jgi:hypothetical protein